MLLAQATLFHNAVRGTIAESRSRRARSRKRRRNARSHFLDGITAAQTLEDRTLLSYTLGSDGQFTGPVPDLSTVTDPTAFPEITLELTRVGSVTSQGDFSPPGTPGGTGAAAARSAYNVNGSGLTIGVISDSFNRLGGHAAGIASGDLPGAGNPNGFNTPVNVLKDDSASSRTDEGRALAEIIHDIAPGAGIMFHSAFIIQAVHRDRRLPMRSTISSLQVQTSSSMMFFF